jgi:hypothetical protein
MLATVTVPVNAGINSTQFLNSTSVRCSTSSTTISRLIVVSLSLPVLVLLVVNSEPSTGNGGHASDK